MKKILFVAQLIVIASLITMSCTKDKPSPPTVTTTDISAISYTSSVSGGNVTNDGKSPITTRGVCWNTSPDPTISNFKTLESGGLGSFASNMTQLIPNTVYYVRAYASNIAGIGYGNQVSFTTSQVDTPTLTTAEITSITQASAVSGGNISSENGGPISERGVCWSTNQNPTTSDSKTSDGTGTGIYSSSISSLTEGTIYYLRAYATNSAGTAYGTQVSFTTLSRPSVTTSGSSVVTLTSAESGGNVTSDGGSVIIARGAVWSVTTSPTISLSSKTIETGTTGTFISSLTGLMEGTTYYARAYATNNIGTAYGNEISFKTQKTGTVTDIEGNVNKTITIGDQTWFTENLKVTKFNDGTAIPNITDGCAWYNSTTPEYCWYNNDISSKDVYGGLYNWYTVNPTSNGGKNVCPVGWHVPTDQEWYTLEQYLTDNGFGYGGSGKKIAKALAAKSGWNTSTELTSPGNNQSTNNLTGFSAISTGARNANNSNCLGFWHIGESTDWWCSPINNDGTNWAREVAWFSGDFIRSYPDKQWGESIRCTKDK